MTTDSSSPNHLAPTRNRHAIDLVVNAPRDRPIQARVMRAAAEEIDRLQTELLDERRRHGEGMDAWRKNAEWHAGEIHRLNDELQRWKFEAGRLQSDLAITRTKLHCHEEANIRQAQRIKELTKL
jgi:hypothetical protein